MGQSGRRLILGGLLARHLPEGAEENNETLKDMTFGVGF
jgi:hypothetical protein